MNICMMLLLLAFIPLLVWAYIQDRKITKEYEHLIKYITRAYEGISFNIVIRPWDRYDRRFFVCDYESANHNLGIAGSFTIKVDTPIEDQIKQNILSRIKFYQQEQRLFESLKTLH